MASFLHRAGWLVALLFLAACHEAPRNNPFDPALTPPVELQVALDDTAGTATLTWTPYQGQQPFAEYQQFPVLIFNNLGGFCLIFRCNALIFRVVFTNGLVETVLIFQTFTARADRPGIAG